MSRRIYAVIALAMACGGSEQPTRAPAPPPKPTVVTQAAPPPPHDRAKKLVMASVACLVGELWNDAEGDAATAAQRGATSRLCAAVVHGVVGEDDPAQVEALRMLDTSITQPLAAKVKEAAEADGLDAAGAAALGRVESAVIASAREAGNARRASAKIRGEIENIKGDRQKQAARDRVALHLTASEVALVPALRSTSGLEQLLRMSDDGDAHAAGLVLALVRIRAAQDLPRHMKLVATAPVLAVVFGVPPPPLPERTKDRLKPGAWLAYATAIAKACGHPVDAAAPAKDRESLAWTGILAGLADRLEADAPNVKNPDLAALVRSAIERLKPL